MYFIAFSFFIILNCGKKVPNCGEKAPNQKNKFGNVPCDSISPLSQYDFITVTMIDRERNIRKDTVIRKIEKNISVFIPCKKYIYKALYYDKKGNLLSNNQILMMSTGKRWEFDDNQDEIIVQYEYTDKQKKIISRYFEKNQFPNHTWQKQIKTGVIENVEEVWMHPFRSNQYIFTEIAPFPKIEYPLKINEKWYSSLDIGGGWGIWSNTSGRSSYEVVSKENLKFPFSSKKIECYKIQSKARFDFGASSLTFLFSREYGFLKKEYLFYTGDKLEIILQEIRY